MEEKPKDSSKEYLKGVLTGILLTVTVIMAIMLFRYGTFGKAGKGAGILTQISTRQKLQTIADIIDASALEQADAEHLVTYMFKGAAAGLNDPYADYYSAEEMEEVLKENAGTYHGIGVVLVQEQKTGIITIQSVYPGSPAEEAGILADDVLTAINGESIEGKAIKEVTNRIGELFDEEDGVVMTFERSGESVDIKVRAAEVETAKVTGQMLEDGIGYMMIPEFDEITVSQFEQTLSGLAEEGMESLIVDVRDNPGGLLDTVTAILDDLLDECVLLTTRTREGEGDRISAKDGTLFSGQIVVLVNEYSASAAEVFSGVLQHYDKAVIIGQDTYGKGTVQKTYSLRDGSAFKLTTEAYAIAGETEIDGKGIVPDLYVEEEDAGAQEQEDVVLARALEYLKEQGA